MGSGVDGTCMEHRGAGGWCSVSTQGGEETDLHPLASFYMTTNLGSCASVITLGTTCVHVCLKTG